MSSRQLTLKLEPEMYARLEAASRREGQTTVAFAKTLIEEGLRMEAHPGIIFHPGPVGRRPSLVDGMDIWQVARLFDGRVDLNEEELREITAFSPVDLDQLQTALRYYAEYRDEIDAWLRMVDEEAERAEAEWLRERALSQR